jgi:hypothetical protein
MADLQSGDPQHGRKEHNVRSRSLAAAGALALAGVGLVAAPAQADIVFGQCTYTITTKYNGQHLLLLTATQPEEANLTVAIYWLIGFDNGVPIGDQIQRRMTGLTLRVNLERAGVNPATISYVGIWTQPRHAQSDGCHPA